MNNSNTNFSISFRWQNLANRMDAELHLINFTYPRLVLTHRAHRFLRAPRQQPGARARARWQPGVRAVKSSIGDVAHHIQRLSFTHVSQVQAADHFWLKVAKPPASPKLLRKQTSRLHFRSPLVVFWCKNNHGASAYLVTSAIHCCRLEIKIPPP